jgi:hypothetical protein
MSFQNAANNAHQAEALAKAGQSDEAIAMLARAIGELARSLNQSSDEVARQLMQLKK